MTKQRYIPLRYDEALLRNIYKYTRQENTTLNRTRSEIYRYSPDQIATMVSTTHRPVTRKDIVELWAAIGRGREGFIETLEWRLKNQETIADAVPKHLMVRLRRLISKEKLIQTRNGTLVPISDEHLLAFADACMRTGSLTSGLELLRTFAIDCSLIHVRDFLQSEYGSSDAFFDHIAPKVRELRSKNNT